MNLFIILLVLPMLKAQGNWKLEWSDEFNDVTIDQDKWEIDQQDSRTCDPQRIKRLNCYTNNTRNVRLIKGSLAITAIQEKWKNKKYTSAWIKTKKTFTFGKFVIRAALPTGKLLSPWVKLVPVKFKNRDGSVNRNQVIIFFNDQTNYIKQGYNLGKRLGNVEHFLSNGNLNEFHSYSIEWNETDIIWKFEEMETNHINLNGTITWLNGPVIIFFYLRVGGNPFGNGILQDEDVDEWECSSYIMDYLRYYQWSNDFVKESPTEDNSTSPGHICKQIMDEIRPIREKSDKESSNNMTIIGLISGLSLVLLITLIPLIAWLVFRMKKLRKSDKRMSEHEYYDDIGIDGMENPKELYNEYEDPTYCSTSYQIMGKDRENYYADAHSGPISPKYEDIQSDYIIMTKASVGHPLKRHPL